MSGINIGHRAILKVVRMVFKGSVVILRCLVHIRRMSWIWLKQDPKSLAGQELLSISTGLQRKKMAVLVKGIL